MLSLLCVIKIAAVGVRYILKVGKFLLILNGVVEQGRGVVNLLSIPPKRSRNEPPLPEICVT